MQIAGLDEICICNTDVRLINDCTMIYSGPSSNKKTRRAHRGALCLDQTAAKIWKDSGSKWEAVSERALKIKLKCCQINIAAIAVYSPMNPVNTQAADENHKFYAELQDAVDRISIQAR